MSTAAKEAISLLSKLGAKVVFAESCTAGRVAATFATVPGASNYLCGSFVTYRPRMKRKLLGVKRKMLRKYTAESPEVAREMALGALENSNADWSASIVGHFGPNSPIGKDGRVWIAIARRTRKGNLKCRMVAERVLATSNREERFVVAAEVVLTLLNGELTRACNGGECCESERICGEAAGTP